MNRLRSRPMVLALPETRRDHLILSFSAPTNARAGDLLAPQVHYEKHRRLRGREQRALEKAWSPRSEKPFHLLLKPLQIPNTNQ